MRDLLVILNPRRIGECLAAFAGLDIDKLWVRNMTEPQIQEHWPQILDRAMHHDRLLVVSDDGVVRPHALQAVRELLDDGHPVVTGYSNLSSEDFRVNLTKGPLRTDVPTVEAYDLYTLAEVLEHPTAVVPTWFAGMCLTGMSVGLWERYPFRVTRNGAQSDFSLAKRLEADRVPIVAAREGFVWHVKERWNDFDREPRKRLFVSGEPAGLVSDLRVAA